MAVPSLPAFDPRAVEALRRAANAGDQRTSIRGAAQQFEALMLQQMLKAMRATVPENTLFDSSARKMWQELSDQQLASDLAKSGGVGLAELLTRQWLPKEKPESMPAKVATDAVATQGVENRTLRRDDAQATQGAVPTLPPVVERSFQQVEAGQAHAAPVSERSFVADPNWLQRLLGLEPMPTPLVAAASAPALIPVEAQGAARANEPSLDSAQSIAPQRDTPQAVAESAQTVASDFHPLPADAPTEERIAAFVRQLFPAAQRAAEALDLSPHFLLAQAALETGWGSAMLRHPDGRPSNNVFNIKAGSDWNGERVRVQTTEYVDGRPQTQVAEFRSYPSIDAAFADYVRLIAENDRYASVRGARSPEAFAQALAAAGYATDPSYARKIVRVLRNATLQNTMAEIGMKFA